MRGCRALTVVAAAHLAPMGCANETSPVEPVAAAREAIVGGQIETGWEGVGALVRTTSADGYRGVFCSATVIAPQWALTAAHCIRTEEFEFFPHEVQLYLGADARPSATGDAPTTGALHQAGALIAHPSYARGRDFDIGLVYLTDPVADAPGVVLNTSSLNNWNIDAEVLHVGFGVDDAEAVTGSGSKRSVTLPLLGYEAGFFFSEPDGSGFCYGDSGGPSILDADGEKPRIAGVASRFEGEPFCVGGYSFSTRVDANVEWLAATMAEPRPGCDTYAGRCACDEACQSDGSCDPSACRQPPDSSGDDGGCATLPRDRRERRTPLPWVAACLIFLFMGRAKKRRPRG